MEFGGLKPCTSNSPDSSRKRNRKRKPAELGESDGLSGKKLKRISALAEAAAKIDPSHLADFFAKPVPLSDIPQPIYKASVNWIKQHPFGDLSHFVSWAIERIIREQHTCGVAAFVALAMSVDLILQLVEKILSNPESRTILVNGAVRDGIQLIPPTSFEILVRFTFPASSARVKTTERFEAIYPLLKEVALAPGSREIFGFSLKLAGEGNPVLAKEATEIAIGLKNKKAITEREALCSIYKEADKSCKVILGRLSSGSGYLKGITAVTAAGAVVAGAVAGAVATVVIGGATGMEYFQ
ncbi:unnamed protein product [Arabidopsis arenosa]|uniref:Uncharacterized protein n=1 Tax=Arabidopsis arenosa TaxID=38785 RepID=A0A8S2A608_ARAAE|nr:unnamed protein product [Arabidopsis arenosa]